MFNFLKGQACFTCCQGFLPWIILYPSNQFTCIFSINSLEFFLCLLWLTWVPVWACKIGYRICIVTDYWCRFPCWVHVEYKWAEKHVIVCVSRFVLWSCEFNFDFPREIGVYYEILGVLCCIGFFVYKKKKRNLWFDR